MALSADGVRIARASDLAPLAQLPIGRCDEVAFLPGGDLLTYNPGWGLCRWPVRRSPGARRLGPARAASPDRLAAHPWVPASWPPLWTAGGSASRVRDQAALLLDPDRPRRRTWLVPHARVQAMAISPDGRWAATAGWGPVPDSKRVKLWDATAGRLLASLDVGDARVAMSPDGHWLGVGGLGRYLFLRAGSWDTVAEVSHGAAIGSVPLAFHPGGRLAVLANGEVGPVRLVEVETGRVLAAFRPPIGAGPRPSLQPRWPIPRRPQHNQRVHIWDLAQIRRRLDELGLAAGLPDVFGGGAARRDRPTTRRSNTSRSSAPTRRGSDG